ncbi:uncharacterized protein LOC123684769 [Harmonia axyridis]|uniref:uncharacterized protein LOC123684769 n=1 Tax=Harmonia axyridis TaxID=115357 RepID=UPI001E275054|nr:uncharacterized protein LOC123684769 [Harmonia axyridis]
MKVLLICFILTIGCHSKEESNATSTTTLSSIPQFESLKIVNESTTAPIIRNTTLTTDYSTNVTTELPVAFKKKPYIKVRKLKKIHKPSHAVNNYRVKEENLDLNRQESRSIGNNPESIESNNLHNTYKGFVDPRRNSSKTYKTYNDFIKEESRPTDNFFKPNESFQRSKYYPYGQKKRGHPYYQILNKNNSDDIRHTEESRRNENYVQFSYKFEPIPQDIETNTENEQHESQNGGRKGGRPSLPEIQNVIHTLDNQDSTPSYKSPKQNHIVEVTEVPLVFEHHYQGDYKNPQSNFVAHQYSYSPPRDPTNEAYRLGKLLSQNVVQNLQTAEEPLREYVHDQQEVILAGFTHGVPTYSFVNFNLNPPKTNIQNPQHVNPLMKYLAPEITPQSFSQDIQHFQTSQLNPYQILRPHTQMQPIVVADEETQSDYGTTYLHAVGAPQHQNQNQQTQTDQQLYHQNQDQQKQTEVDSAPKSPYSVNVQQEYVHVPKYKFTNHKHNKPQAIHEVEPPNLGGFANPYNLNSLRFQIPAAAPTPFPEIMRNPSYDEVQTEEEQHNQQVQTEDQNMKLRLEGLIPTTKLIHYVLPQQSPTSTPTLVHRPRPQTLPTRPFWRKPQVMKLVRVPERVNQHQEAQSYQSHYQGFRSPGAYEDDSRTRNQQLYQSLAEHYSTPVRMNQVLSNQQHHEDYSNNIMRLVPQKVQQDSGNQFNNRPIVVEDVYQNQNEEEPREVYVANTYDNQIDDNSVKYQNLGEQNYQDDKPSPEQNTNQGNVEVVKSISKYYPQHQEQNNHGLSMYRRPVQEDPQMSSELPKGYLSFQHQKNFSRPPNTRHIMPLVRYRNRENYDSNTRILNPRIRRLVNDLLRDNTRRKNVYVVMTEE